MTTLEELLNLIFNQAQTIALLQKKIAELEKKEQQQK